MAGHSKWANTKHRKAIQDAKRGKIFTKIIRELVTAARLGGGYAASNPRLRSAIDKALSSNMTRDTLNRAIARGICTDENNQIESLIYEGFGPGGTAIMIECLSHNRKRTVSDIRQALNKFGGNLGNVGSVAYLFTKTGLIGYESGVNFEQLMEAAVESGAEDLVESPYNGVIYVYAKVENFGRVKDYLDLAGFQATLSKITTIPITKINLDYDSEIKLFSLIKLLEDYDDVQEVYHNGNITNLQNIKKI